MIGVESPYRQPILFVCHTYYQQRSTAYPANLASRAQADESPTAKNVLNYLLEHDTISIDNIISNVLESGHTVFFFF